MSKDHKLLVFIAIFACAFAAIHVLQKIDSRAVERQKDRDLELKKMEFETEENEKQRKYISEQNALDRQLKREKEATEAAHKNP